MYLENALKEIFNNNNWTKYSPIVLNVPSYFTTGQLGLLRSICSTLDLNMPKLNGFLNDYISYTTLFAVKEGKSIKINDKRYVLFVNIGDYSATSTCVTFGRSEGVIVSHNFIREYGGKEINYLLLNEILKQIKKEKNQEITDKKKIYSLLVGTEVLKKQLSQSVYNPTSVTFANILDNNDSYRCEFTSKQLNEILDNHKYWSKLLEMINNTLSGSKWTNAEIKNLEIYVMGGTMNIPYFKNKIEEHLSQITDGKNKQINVLDLNDCIAKGCSLNGLVTKHLSWCKKPKCKNCLHYTIKDNSYFTHNKKSLDKRINCDDILLKSNKYEENDIAIKQKSIIGELLHKTIIDSREILKDNKLYNSEYKAYVNYIKQYFDICSNLKINDKERYDYNNLNSIYDDMLLHKRILLV